MYLKKTYSFSCHDFMENMKKGHSNLSKNEPENIS